jgi:hypothetical protein
MQLDQSISTPSWVESGARQLKGLDLLGLRLQVQQIGDTLLDGVTTITPSVRYLSFRSWIILSYIEAGHANKWEAFRDFASRVEAAIAFGNLLRKPDITGVLGSDEAEILLAQGTDPIRLKELVKQLGISVYAGPSDQLGLSFTESEVPGLTVERGLPLGRLVQTQTAVSALGTGFGKGELVEQAGHTDLMEFGQIVSIREIPESERQMLVTILMPDLPRSVHEKARLATYAALLFLAHDLSRLPKEQDLFDAATALHRQTPPELEDVLDGWLRYAVRDLIAVTHEAVLSIILRELEMAGRPGSPIAAAEVIACLMSRIDEHSDALRSLQLLEPGESPLDLDFQTVETRVQGMTEQEVQIIRGLRRWLGPLHEMMVYGIADSSGAGALALLPVAWILARRRVEPGMNSEHPEFQALSTRGWARIGLREVNLPSLERFRKDNWKYRDIMAELAYRTVDQHLRISWSRMKDDPKRDVALMSTDGDSWTLRSLLRPGRTASRLREASSWLRQLGLLDASGLTSDGQKALNRSINILRSGK